MLRSAICPDVRGVGPIGLLAPERLVVDGATVGEVDQLGNRKSPWTGAPAELDVLGELLRERSQDARHDDPFLDCEVAAAPIGDMTQPPGDRVQIPCVTEGGAA